MATQCCTGGPFSIQLSVCVFDYLECAWTHAAGLDNCASFGPQEEFGYNADTQKLLAKNGETLLGAINFFICSVNTLVDKTIEDTMLNIKQYETARYVADPTWFSFVKLMQFKCISSQINKSILYLRKLYFFSFAQF